MEVRTAHRVDDRPTTQIAEVNMLSRLLFSRLLNEVLPTSLHGTADPRDRKQWYTHETRVLKVARPLVSLWFHTFADVQVEGTENIPSGPVILASNHITMADVFVLGLELPRHPYFMGKAELFKTPVVGWVYRKFGTFPVHRGEADVWAFRQAANVLNVGQMLAMFPEGTRSRRTAALRPAKTGAVRLALRHRVSIVPAAISGSETFFAHGAFAPRHARIHLSVGEPIDVAALAPPGPPSYETLTSLTTHVMKTIAAMLPPAYRGVYA